ncbi:alkaline phosphatase PhoX [Microscilla marina]|nr:alkaline phosphatase PhoX [Microscilla marina]
MKHHYLTTKWYTFFCICLMIGISNISIAQTRISVRVSSSNDDAEERGSNAGSSPGRMYLNSSDLELVRDGSTRGNQWVGMLFRNLNIPRRAVITSAYVQFTADETNSGTTNLVIRGEDTNSAGTFSSSNNNISSRNFTSSRVNWNNVPAWNSVGEAGSRQRTPDLRRIVQEIVNRNGWVSGNNIAIIINGSGERTAESYNGSSSRAPLLVVNYTNGGGSGCNYCTSTSNRSTYEHIAKVEVGGFSNSSGANNYTNFTNRTINLSAGQRYNIRLTPGFSGSSYQEYFKVWIDYNGDCDFNDAGELVYDAGSTASSTVSGSIRIPANITRRTRMRVSMKYNGAATACENFQDGEVEDYTVNIGSGGGTPPVAAFVANRTNIRVGQSVNFSNRSTNNPSSYSWVFSGGSPSASTATNPVVTYNRAGRFTVRLTARNAYGSDVETKTSYITVSPSNGGCNKISCFTSISPTSQTSRLIIPSSHRFQMLMKQGDSYTTGGGNVPGNHDFTGYVPINNSSTNGYLSVNHENTPGGVSMMRLSYSNTSKLWNVNSNQAVDFYNNNLVTTTRNCSGGITPWGTVITCEETYNSGDNNNDGYEDVGWCVEIDPVTKRVKSYGNGKQEKLWALGRMRHENVVVASDRRTVYYGEDGGTSCVYKFVANSAQNLSRGRLYVLKLDGRLSGGNPTRSTGRWVQVPNNTKSDRNNTSSIASSLGGNNFSGVEDVEIHPINGKVYYTSKGNGRVYRFNDNGSTISGFEVFVGGRSYPIATNSGTVNESWGGGNDNLAFDNDGNLWVLQDGGRDYIWMVENGHTQSNPKVKLFGSSPNGSEPTGITFSPDGRFMFLSIQHPSFWNSSQTDAAGNSVRFNKSSTVVIALNKNLGTLNNRTTQTTIAQEATGAQAMKVFPNPPAQGKVNVAFATEYEGKVVIDLLTTQGQKITTLFNKHLQAGKHQLAFDLNRHVSQHQNLLIVVTANGKRQTSVINYQK